MFMVDDIESDEEILKMIDQVGENYGAIVSYIFGFEKKFNGEEHVHKSLQMPKLPEVSMPKVSLPQFSFPEFHLPEFPSLF